MPKYFFTYETNMPEGAEGFKPYTAPYFITIAILIIYISVIVIYYTRLNRNKKDKFKKSFAILIIILEILRRAVALYLNSFVLDEIPFHLCGMSTFIYLWNAFRPNRTNKTIIYSLSLPGAVAALMFPAWNTTPLINFFSLHSFIQHANLAAYPLMLLFAGELDPKVKDLWRSVVFLVITGIPLFFLNKVWNTNFMFLNIPAPDSPLIVFERILGNPGYIFGLALLLLTLWVIMYTPFVIGDCLKNNKNKLK